LTTHLPEEAIDRGLRERLTGQQNKSDGNRQKDKESDPFPSDIFHTHLHY
jgi:hypothetical protein